MQETNLIEQEQPGGVTTPVPAPAPTMTLCSYGTTLTREELARVCERKSLSLSAFATIIGVRFALVPEQESWVATCLR